MANNARYVSLNAQCVSAQNLICLSSPTQLCLRCWTDLLDHCPNCIWSLSWTRTLSLLALVWWLLPHASRRDNIFEDGPSIRLRSNYYGTVDCRRGIFLGNIIGSTSCFEVVEGSCNLSWILRLRLAHELQCLETLGRIKTAEIRLVGKVLKYFLE